MATSPSQRTGCQATHCGVRGAGRKAEFSYTGAMECQHLLDYSVLESPWLGYWLTSSLGSEERMWVASGAGASSQSWGWKRNHGAHLPGLAPSDLPPSLLHFPSHQNTTSHNCQSSSLSPKVILCASGDTCLICWEISLLGAIGPSLSKTSVNCFSQDLLRGVLDQTA